MRSSWDLPKRLCKPLRGCTAGSASRSAAVALPRDRSRARGSRAVRERRGVVRALERSGGRAPQAQPPGNPILAYCSSEKNSKVSETNAEYKCQCIQYAYLHPIAENGDPCEEKYGVALPYKIWNKPATEHKLSYASITTEFF